MTRGAHSRDVQGRSATASEGRFSCNVEIYAFVQTEQAAVEVRKQPHAQIGQIWVSVWGGSGWGGHVPDDPHRSSTWGNDRFVRPSSRVGRDCPGIAYALAKPTVWHEPLYEYMRSVK